MEPGTGKSQSIGADAVRGHALSPRHRHYHTLAVAILICAACSCTNRAVESKPGAPQSRLSDLDTAVRGDLAPQVWRQIDQPYKFERCIDHKTSEFRRMVSGINEPVDLIDAYPKWQARLGDCQRLYQIDSRSAELQAERVASEIAKIIGDETAAYLHEQRLFKGTRPEAQWVDDWRTGVIIRIGSFEHDQWERRKGSESK